MHKWQSGDAIVIRNVSRSDGTVSTALPAIVIQDEADLLAVYIAKGTTYKNNYVVPPEQRVAMVSMEIPSAQREFKDLITPNNSIRLYLPGQRFATGLTFDDHGALMSWYGNLEAPFVRTPIGIDSRDYALDVVAFPDGRWKWKDEDEFERRLEVGLDSPEHQARVRAAGEEFIRRFEHNEFPFNAGWQTWQAPADWQPQILPDDWKVDFGTHALLTADHE